MSKNLKRDWEDRNPAATEVTKDDEGKRTITVLYFATLAKRLGLESETITLPEEIASIDDLIPWLMTRRGEWKRALSGTLRITMNQRFVGMTDLISDGDEIALAVVVEENIR
jgi:molybdopterin converting factor small subunit